MWVEAPVPEDGDMTAAYAVCACEAVRRSTPGPQGGTQLAYQPPGRRRWQTRSPSCSRATGERDAGGRAMPGLVVVTTEAQVTAAKEKLNATIDGVQGFRQAFPRYCEAVEHLPDLRWLMRLGVELRGTLLDALVAEGVAVPRDVWVQLGIGHLAPTEGRTP